MRNEYRLRETWDRGMQWLLGLGTGRWMFGVIGLMVPVLILAMGCGRKVKDVVVFRVNGQDVYQSEVELLGRNVLFKAGIKPGTAEARRHLETHGQNIYDTLIDLYLIQQAAQATQKPPSEEEIDQAIQAFKKSFADPKDYEQFVELSGLSLEEIRLTLRHKILAERFQLAKLNEAKKKLTQEDLRKWYEDHRQDFRAPNRLRLRHILFLAPPNAKPEDMMRLKERAEHIRKTLTGTDEKTFASTAREISQDKPTAPSGGDLGFVTLNAARKSFPAGIADAIFKLKKGEISPVLQSNLGYHIFMVVDDQEEFKEAKAEIQKRMVIASFAAWLANARKKAKIEILKKPEEVFASNPEASPTETASN